MKKFLVIIFVPFFLYACTSTKDDVREEKEESKDFSSSQVQEVRVKTMNGSMTSSARDDDSIHVVFKKWATGEDKEDARENMDDIVISIDEDAASGVLSIDIDMPTSEEPDYGCDVSLSLPSSLSLDLESLNGNIEIKDAEADATLETLNGKITARNHYGQLSGSTSNGDINVDIVLPDQGECTLKTSNGSIALSIPDTTSATVKASTANGKIEVETALNVSATKTEEVKFEGKIGAGEGNIELESLNGDISIKRK